ncbi:hypothetical protein [Pedobacter sp. V48]|uniref:hypothetical protein n=1 Tax=Pedobacter sp. V48 TaxID=509635 RepID=UPI0003E5C570|nr:hypothetical protein [Pedobacter sp. V48]ETZ22844.1 hypothetical protein N824_21380 [Pedobacter sp. V48]
MEHKTNLIILASTNEESDMAFYKTVIRPNSLLFTKAVVLMFSNPEQLFDFLDAMHDDFNFTLLIHPGVRTMTKGDDGAEMIKAIEHHPVYKNMVFDFVSREGSPGKKFEGRELHHANSMPDKDFELNSIPSNNLGLVRGNLQTTSQMAQVTDFAILTALYEHEFAVFEDECKIVKTNQGVNAHTAHFKNNVALPNGEDYRSTFFVIHQERMGLVDAAIHATEVLTRIKPRFLIMPGVCGGKIGKVKQYDVIVPTEVHDYATGKFKNGKLESLEYTSSTDKKLIAHLQRNKTEIIANMQKLINKSRKDLLKEFDIHFDQFACGPWVVKTTGMLDKMSSSNTSLAEEDYNQIPVENIDKNIIGLEMESYSILRANEILKKQSEYSLVVKSVMDFTNENKSDGKFGEIKSSAAYVSALCVRAMMPFLIDFK